jgi:hypothetical protein
MRNHTLNLFAISNIAELNFSYKLVQFELPSYDGNEESRNKKLQKLALAVSSATSGPAAIVNREGRKYVAIPANKTMADTRVDVGSLIVQVKLLPQVYQANASQQDEGSQHVIFKFCDYEIRRQLGAHRDLWKMNTGQFFEKTPKPTHEGSNINIFKGFAYKLVRLEDGNFYIVLDLSTKYIDKRRLSQYVNAANLALIGKRFLKKRFLYLNGESWYPIELVSFGERIDTHTFKKDDREWIVKDYIYSRPGARRDDMLKVVKPEDLAMLYTYPGRDMEPHNGATSLARMLYRTDDPEVRSFHRQSIKDPARRFEQIQGFIGRYFQHITFNGTALAISRQPLEEHVRSFQMPGLKFFNDRVLSAAPYQQGGTTSLKDFGYNRKAFLERNGALNRSPFDSQYLMVPASMEKSLVEAFKAEAETAIRKLSPRFTTFKVVRYPYTEGLASTLQMKEIEKVLAQHQALSGYALFILPDLSSESNMNIRGFHNQLKNKFYPGLQLQCASAFKINGYFAPVAAQGQGSPLAYKVLAENRNRFQSYLFNLTLELLIVNRKWPFALAKPLHYDIYIGVDVHDRYAGFTFFFKNGEQIFFSHHQVPKRNRSQRAEKLKAKLLHEVIYEKLKTFIPGNCPLPNGIVLLRDGRSFGEEEEALTKVIADLKADGTLTNDPQWGIIDLHKQSAVPLRVALQTDGHEALTNPQAGSYKLINGREGFIFNTGYPFGIRGSAKPQHLSLKAGNLTFLKVLEDIFCQSMLAFSAPDRSNSLPISIKLIDILLEPLAASVEEVEEEEEADDIFES